MKKYLITIWSQNPEHYFFIENQIDISDTTGAGDTFAGGFIAAEMSGVTSPNHAAKAGLKAAESMLMERKGKTKK